MEKAIKKNRGIWKAAVPTGTALAVAHSLAVINGWYRSIPWIDIPIHFWWAIALGLVAYWIIQHFPEYIDLDKSFLFTVLVALSLSALGGVLWEFGEFIYDTINSSYGFGASPVQLGLRDTLADILFDMLGGLAVAIFVRLRYHRKKKAI